MSTDSTATALQTVIDMLTSTKIDTLIVGGFAVNAYGYSRSTVDVDCMIAVEDTEAIINLMTDNGYTDFSCLENVLLFNRPGTSLRIDFLRADYRTMQTLLSRSRKVKLMQREVLIPSLTDLIAMKLFSVKHARSRRADKDIPDVVFLALFNDLDLEKNIKPICAKYDALEIYEELCKRIEKLKDS